jgi:hypothetical protein
VVVNEIDGVLKLVPVPKLDPPVADEYQFIIPDEASADKVNVPEPQRLPGVTDIIVGEILSYILIECIILTELPHASVIVYVLVIIIGEEPVVASEYVTINPASVEHPSVIVIPPGSASRADTVVTAAGAEPILHPSTIVGVRDPTTVGAVISST